ncbi:alpha/beta fold hydrolase [Nocardia testacea]|uniref:alpha/beta fold hydrolase n=1 Tax=Nocardia testacea TaxID=248551 RepID=UPI0002ECDE51|nr:alpha/beta hydrolase [Nocardia testacea]
MASRPNSLYATAAGVEYHCHDMGAGSPTLFLHGGGPGCTAWSDFGPVAELFAGDRRALLVDPLQYGKSDESTITREKMVPRGHLYVMDRASHHLQEERPYDYCSVVTGFLNQQHP